MITRRAFSVVVTALLAIATAPVLAAHSADNDPLAFVSAIYSRVTSGNGDLGGAFMQETEATKTRYFSRKLIALWAKADAHVPNGDIGPIDTDLATNSQDPSVRSFTATTETSNRRAATIKVTLQRGSEQPRKFAEDDVLRYDLVRDRGVWRIDDIRGATDAKPWSMRARLNYELRH